MHGVRDWFEPRPGDLAWLGTSDLGTGQAAAGAAKRAERPGFDGREYTNHPVGEPERSEQSDALPAIKTTAGDAPAAPYRATARNGQPRTLPANAEGLPCVLLSGG